jgi:hypothetical protein
LDSPWDFGNWIFGFGLWIDWDLGVLIRMGAAELYRQVGRQQVISRITVMSINILEFPAKSQSFSLHISGRTRKLHEGHAEIRRGEFDSPGPMLVAALGASRNRCALNRASASAGILGIVRFLHDELDQMVLLKTCEFVKYS